MPEDSSQISEIDGCLGKITRGDTCRQEVSANNGLTKELLNHWWEVPGSGLRGRAVSSIFPTQMQTEIYTSIKAGPPLEVQITSDTQDSLACSETVPMSSSISVAERVHAVSRSLQEGGKSQKEFANKWSEEEGKMIVQSDVFSAVLPSADEVGLQWRISELRVALQASERTRLEGEQETEGLRKYLAEVEAAAASLQLRVQELEHLIEFSSKDELREVDQLRAKMALEASKEAQNQTARAAMAVAAAREATMELDKANFNLDLNNIGILVHKCGDMVLVLDVKRHASSMIRAHEEEAERLRKEAADCRTLYHARTGQLRAFKERIEKLEHEIKSPATAVDAALRISDQKLLELQKSLEDAKLEAQEKSMQILELLQTCEHQKGLVQSAQNRLNEMERQKEELAGHIQMLEQQVAELRSQEMEAQQLDHENELQKVKEVLESEKQQLLAELTSLRCGNQTLQAELSEWQEKFQALSQYISAPRAAPSAHKPSTMAAAKCSSIMLPADSHKTEDSCISDQQNDEKQIWNDSATSCRDMACTTADRRDTGCFRPMPGERNVRSCCKGQTDTLQQCCCEHLCDSCTSGNKKVPLQESHGQEKRSSLGTDTYRDMLLAAAHKEIVRLKEINQCLLAAFHHEFRMAQNVGGFTSAKALASIEVAGTMA